MKKLLSLLLIITLCVAFSACRSAEETNTEHTDNDPITNDSRSEDAMTAPIVSCSNLEEYQDYIQSHKMPDNFVTYENISALGTFDGFVWYPSNSFYYSIVNGEAQFGLNIFTNYTPSELVTVTMLDANVNSDMRVCPGTSEGVEYFSCDDVQYMYVYGDLAFIIWDIGSTRFQLNLGPASKNYTGDNAAINALLNKDTAGSVKLAFDNMMAEKAAE